MPEPTDMLPPARHSGGRRAGAGRPPTITPEIVAEFARFLRAGNFFETVCDFLGVERATAKEWMRRGKRELVRMEREGEETPAERETLYVEFLLGNREAVSASEMHDLAIIGQVAAGKPRRITRRTLPDGTQEEVIEEGMAPNWQAASWRLTRKRPARFGQTAPIKVQHEGTKDGPPIQHEVAGRVTFYLPDNGRAAPLTQPNTEDEEV